MKRLHLLLLANAVVVTGFFATLAMADASHARIVRLSLVQGDVRFTPQYHHDSLTDTRAGWEMAPLNLPIRQGYAISTGVDGRAEIEFENGAMAFLSPNTVAEFYDLSLYDGALITRLVLRQGSGIFYVHPARGDYFSVTGGDFSVEVPVRAQFRLDNFDDGSNVNVEMGHVTVLHKEETKDLTKGQSYSVNVNEGGNAVLGRAPDSDDFDKWVSGRIDSVATATNYANQYLNSPDYTSGFADLYNYGSWINVGGYGYGWQPYGVAIGWCPFSYGSWIWDASMGWNFIGSAPWGWLPYHYGGWVFSPAYGWVWVPTGFGFRGGGYGGRLPYRPVTGVWVHNGAAVGLVPSHPTDAPGKPPVNLGRGIYALQGGTVGSGLLPSAGQRWSAEKTPPRNSLAASTLATTAAPTRVSRTILSSPAGSRAVTVSRDSSIVYDASQHRFVNGNSATKLHAEEAAADGKTGASVGNVAQNKTAIGNASRNTEVPARTGGSAPARPNITPPRPTSSYGGAAHSSGAGATWGGSGSHASGGSSSSHSSSAGATVGGGSHSSAGGGSSHH